MKIVAISDTHNQHGRLDMSIYNPEATLIVAGDITSTGTLVETAHFLDWLESLNFKHKIFIAGNHDFYTEDFDMNKLLTMYKTITYLENTSIEIDGYKFYGTPNTPRFFDWAFNCNPEELITTWNSVPVDTDVLICHGPPKDILDLVNNNLNPDPHVGDPYLRKMLEETNIPYCIFGHIHEQGGKSEQLQDTLCYNVSVLDEKYKVSNKPTEFTLKPKKENNE